MFIKDNKRFNIYQRYTDPLTGESGIDMTRLENRQRFNVQEVADPVRKDDRFYYINELTEEPFIVHTAKPLSMICDMLWGNIKQIRDELIESGGCLLAGKWYHSDAKSKQQQMALYMKGSSLPAGIMWKTMDGTFVEMTQQLASNLFDAQMTREFTIFAFAEARKVSMANMTIEELETFDYRSGWYPRYGDS
jgi:hypothetical protein